MGKGISKPLRSKRPSTRSCGPAASTSFSPHHAQGSASKTISQPIPVRLENRCHVPPSTYSLPSKKQRPRVAALV